MFFRIYLIVVLFTAVVGKCLANETQVKAMIADFKHGVTKSKAKENEASTIISVGGIKIAWWNLMVGVNFDFDSTPELREQGKVSFALPGTGDINKILSNPSRYRFYPKATKNVRPRVAYGEAIIFKLGNKFAVVKPIKAKDEKEVLSETNDRILTKKLSSTIEYEWAYKEKTFIRTGSEGYGLRGENQLWITSSAPKGDFFEIGGVKFLWRPTTKYTAKERSLYGKRETFSLKIEFSKEDQTEYIGQYVDLLHPTILDPGICNFTEISSKSYGFGCVWREKDKFFLVLRIGNQKGEEKFIAIKPIVEEHGLIKCKSIYWPKGYEKITELAKAGLRN